MLDRALSDEVHHAHRLLLAKAMDAADALLEHGGIPGQVHIDYHGGVLEVKPDAAGVRGQKGPAAVIFPEAVHESFALLSRDAAMKQDVIPVASLKAALQ